MKQSSLTTGVVQAMILAYQQDEGEATAEVGSVAWFGWLEQAFRTAWSEGQLLTPEQALAAHGQEMLPTPMPARPKAAPAGLTAREVEVLRLLAQGLTDAQIAEHLVISPRTVNRHITSLYSKLGVSSRAAATRFAHERHLL